MNMNEPPSLLRKDYAGSNHWLELKLSGTKSNRTAVVARVIVRSNERTITHSVLSQTSYYSHNDLRLHFSLGRETQAAELAVYWPSGHVTRLKDVAGNRLVKIKEE